LPLGEKWIASRSTSRSTPANIWRRVEEVLASAASARPAMRSSRQADARADHTGAVRFWIFSPLADRLRALVEERRLTARAGRRGRGSRTARAWNASSRSTPPPRSSAAHRPRCRNRARPPDGACALARGVLHERELLLQLVAEHAEGSQTCLAQSRRSRSCAEIVLQNGAHQVVGLVGETPT
jgi:hypothetical protein